VLKQLFDLRRQTSFFDSFVNTEKRFCEFPNSCWLTAFSREVGLSDFTVSYFRGWSKSKEDE
jgi:hypothetical protein